MYQNLCAILIRKRLFLIKKTELFDSIYIGDIKKTTLLLKLGISPDIKSDSGQAPIHVAVLFSNLPIVKKLLRFKADINMLNCNGSTALDLAICQQDQDTIEFLLDRGAKVDIGSTPTLYLATLNGKKEVVKLLYNRGANIGLKSDKGCTALFPAVSSDYIEIANFLLELGANVNDSDIYGTYLVHLAVSHAKNIDMVTLLCDYGANVDVQDNMGRTALFIAITCYAQGEKDMKDIIGFLLTKKARSDISDRNGDYPIHLAIKQMGHPVIVEMLLITDQNNVNYRDLTELTPLNLATKCGNLDAVLVLVKYSSIRDIGYAIATENEEVYPAIERFLLQCMKDRNIKDGIKPISVGSVILREVECSKLPEHKTRGLFMLKRKRSNDSSSTKSSSFYSISTQSSLVSFKSCLSTNDSLCSRFDNLLDFDQFECDSVLPAVKRVKISR
ncbi:ankyrin repeat domain-containing protein [Candidatus Mesenet endosymbiont of Phosphuga atrata]|uniref:ankyrin repeat domain-containing protein n=1 Tax=Candidatus Mesenet endosymbiont of Phosphuga atrata TaxID=3066221 RepID=UPI0030D049CC